MSLFCLTNLPPGIIIVLLKQYLLSAGEMASLDSYYNALEVSRRLKVHPETVKRLCRQGDIPAIKFHITWLIADDDLDNFAATYIPRRGARKRLL